MKFYTRNLGRRRIYASDDSDIFDEIHEIGQEFTSENTSINSKRLPAIFNMVSFEPGTVNLDYGGGKFDNVAEYLEQYDVVNLVYDPYNRSTQHNKQVIQLIREHGGADTATCSNVLNVIKEPEVRLNVLSNISKLVKPGGVIYITVYEGTGKGDEHPTKSGYQLNRKTKDYMDEITQVFPDAYRKGKLIICQNTQSSVTASRYMEYDDDQYKFEDYINITFNGETLHVDECETVYGNYIEYYIDEDETECFKANGYLDTWDSFGYDVMFYNSDDDMGQHLELDDSTSVEEHCYDLLEPFVSDTPGTYKIYGDVELCYDVNAKTHEVSWNEKASKVSNIRIERID